MPVPNPETLHPIPGFSNTVFLRPLLESKPELTNIEVGDYSYFSSFDAPEAFFERNVRYNFGYSGAKLKIGRYCAIAHGTTFIMPDANHATGGPTSFPFPIFGGDWREAMPLEDIPFPQKGDTVVGSDVWFGYESLVMPGVRIGHGAIIAAGAVVSRDVPDYAIVAGNPAEVVRRRYSDRDVERLLALAWWGWPVAAVTAAIPLLVKGELGELERFAAERLQEYRGP